MRNITVGITIHNKQELIPKLIEGLKKSFSPNDEFLFEFDNCTDDSFKILTESKEELLSKAVITGEFFDAGVVGPDDLFEIKANNVLLKHFMDQSVNDTIILFQDDQVCNDPKIKEKIFRVQQEVPNLGLMGGRSGYELNSTRFPEMPIRKISNWEHKQDQYGFKLGEGGYANTTFLNRGPIVFTRELIDKVGYLDEAYYPQQCDDLDYAARCKYKYGLENIVFQCNIISKLEWGSTRRKDSNLYKLTKGKHVRRNWDLFCNRWSRYFTQ